MKLLCALMLVLVACGGQTGGSGAVNDSSLTITEYEDMGREHLSPEEEDAFLNGAAPPEYSSSPASSGKHAAQWAPCGVFREELADIYTVHSLEHGAVIIFYRPDLPEQEIGQLEDLVTELATHIIVMPRTGLTSPIVLAAWGRLGVMEGLDIEAIRGFWLEYAQRGPEPGVSCPLEVDQRAAGVNTNSDY
jgi:hypothetical protein